ncbi:hypothetical protein CTAYLR_007941 [Chrysophaeum taylorii]|uniref:non-specific serine/threonine protein kinase n=1 Tax=Chrysophaeum taylorii TaxID=2483200 RepID=A0AAD7XR40_9STRA|nr:hypothetical protein CTAYLR_007941 [Chrysophaeum taylorii]
MAAAAKKTVGKYEIGRTLGEGTFGKVKHAVNTETGEQVAIKVLDKERIQKQSMGAQIKKEISIMKQLEHPNVVKLKEVLASRTKIFIVLELVTGGELFDLIVKSGRLAEPEAKRYFRQLVDGVSYCHSQGVAHRDLKPENLLLDEHVVLKISDFGLSALYDGDQGASRSQMLHTTCGTPNYVAPEVLQNEGYDGRIADCWSIGVILYVLLAGFLPFDEQTMSALFAKIKAADYAYPDFFSKQVVALIDKILVADPNLRATLLDVKDDPWLSADDHKKNASYQRESADAVDAPAPAKKVASSRVLEFQTSKSPTDAAAQLARHLHDLDCAVNQPDDFSLEASLVTPNGLVSLTALITPKTTDDNDTKTNPPTPADAAVIRILRGKGDILAFNAFQAKLLDHLKPILDSPP